jgi:hypothetical protein
MAAASSAAAKGGAMSTTELESREPAAEEYVRYTPFQDSYAFEAEPALAGHEQLEAAPIATPFVSEYEGVEPGLTPEAFELHELLFQLYDEEFNEVLEEIAQHSWSAAHERAEMFGETAGSTTAEEFLQQWIAPVQEQAESLLDNIAQAASEHDIASMSESEVDQFFEQFEPRETGLEQYFEDFLKGIVNKAKNVVQKVASLAKKGLTMLPGVGMLLGKLKALVKPLLNRVLRIALDKLPPKLRPVARQLAQRLLGKVALEAEDTEAEDFSAPQAAPDVSTAQQQFDLDTATLLFADETEQEVIVTEVAYEADRTDGAPIAELHEARERFVDEIERGVPPQEALENFIPAVMAVQPIARTAIGIIGRPRVVNFLAGFLARLIGKYVPPEAAKQLSQAIVDTGLRMISLEAPSEAEVKQLAPDAIVATVEDTVRRVAELDEATFENPALLEAEATLAFHEAAAENFPTEMLIAELHEASPGGAWVSMPLGKRRRKYYKKYTRVFDVQITPQMAESLKTFGGSTIAAFLKDKLGLAAPVQARVHLYQATTGTSLGRIAPLERGPRGLGKAGRVAVARFHPLTPEAAGILLQQPKLGRNLPAHYVARRRRIAVGQRFYYLEIAGARPPARVSGNGTRAAVNRSSQVNVTLDFPKDEFRVFVYLSEADAQDIAAKMRKRDFTAVVLTAKKIYEAGVTTALGGELRRHVKILNESLPQEQFVGKLLGRLTQDAKQQLARGVTQWVGRAISNYVTTRGAELVTATEDPADGATLVVTIVNPPGAPVVRKLLRGEGIGPEALRDIGALFKGDPKVSATTVAGFRFD